MEFTRVRIASLVDILEYKTQVLCSFKSKKKTVKLELQVPSLTIATKKFFSKYQAVTLKCTPKLLVNKQKFVVSLLIMDINARSLGRIFKHVKAQCTNIKSL